MMEHSDCGILGLDTMQFCGWILTPWSTMRLPSTEFKFQGSCLTLKVSISVELGTNPSALKMEAAHSFKMSVSTHETTQCENA
jgi:hypothetical protein